jgi:hypothetical protein
MRRNLLTSFVQKLVQYDATKEETIVSKKQCACHSTSSGPSLVATVTEEGCFKVIRTPRVCDECQAPWVESIHQSELAQGPKPLKMVLQS